MLINTQNQQKAEKENANAFNKLKQNSVELCLFMDINEFDKLPASSQCLSSDLTICGSCLTPKVHA
jgi:hypothetical protein